MAGMFLRRFSLTRLRGNSFGVGGVGTLTRGFSSANHGSNSSDNQSFNNIFAYSLAAFTATAISVNNITSSSCDPSSDKPKPSGIAGYGKVVQGVMMYTHDELKEMVEKNNIIVAYRGSLYDISDFTGHPGGVGRLQMAAGGDLEIYWKVYTQHNRGHITADVMKPYKIGEVTPEDMKAITADTYYDDSAYSATPTYPDLLVNTRYPYNAEGRLRTLTENWVTPEGKHFVRNHSAVPEINIDEYVLTIEGKGVNTTKYTLDDLKSKFESVDVHSVIQCNGNRREDFHYVDGKTPAFGPPHWVAGAIGHSKWTGPRLRDVLRASGMDVDAMSLGKIPFPESEGPLQIGLLGMDQDEVGNQYCCSFPFDKSIDPFGDCILALEMNGKPIPRSHGYPVRAIVPGHAGARNCKYLERVTVTDTPCCDFCNWKQYAVHAPDVAMRKIAEFEVHAKELKQDPAVQEMPVQSMITYPSAGDILCAARNGAKSVFVKGIAWGGGGSGINRVDVSIDNGTTFTRAEVLKNPIEQRRKSQWSWVFFEKEVPISEHIQKEILSGKSVDMVLTSKALNSAWNVQPETMEPNWNSHGCCVNHWYRVPVTLCPRTDCDLHLPDGDFANKPSGGKFRRPFRNLDQPEDAINRSKENEVKKTFGCSTVNCTCGNNCVCGTGCQSSCIENGARCASKVTV